VYRIRESPRSKLGRARVPDAVSRKKDIGKSLDILREAFRMFNRRLKFSVNEEIDRVVVKVVDGSTDKVIKEIPPEEIQKLVARIRETIGILFDEEI
jgi:flagellar protein FlaG